jgi:hypothetical protein
MNEATVISINPGQQPNIMLLHHPFELIEDGWMDGDVRDKGVAVGRGRACSYFAIAHGVFSGLALDLIVEPAIYPASGW